MSRRSVLSVIMPLLCLASSGQEKFIIQGRLGHLTAPAKIFLHYFKAAQWITDSAILKDGVFEIKGAVAFPEEALLTIRRDGGGFVQPGAPMENKNIYLENGMINVVAEDSLQKAVVEGGPVNRDYQALERLMQPHHEHSRQWGEVYNHTPVGQRQTQAFKDTVSAMGRLLQTEERAGYACFIRLYPNSPIGLNLLKYSYGHYPPVDVVAPLYDLLTPGIKNTKEGKEYGALVGLWLRTNIGQTAPDFTQEDTAGKPVSLYGFRGKYVLLNFWATWCGPCMMEKPALRAIYQDYKDKGFEILDVSMIDKMHQFGDRKKWLEDVRLMRLAWKNVYGNEAVDLYGIETVPQDFLIDPQGKIIGHNLYGDALRKKLAALL